MSDQQSKAATTGAVAAAAAAAAASTTVPAPPPTTAPLTIEPFTGDLPNFGANLKLLSAVTLDAAAATPLFFAGQQQQTQRIVIAALGGSVLDATVDAVVNAANTGGVAGFGIDEMVNRAGGDALKGYRKAHFFNTGIPTGTCRWSPSFEHKKRCKYFLHAVGPVLRENALDGGSGKKMTLEQKFEQLSDAYFNSLAESTKASEGQDCGCASVAFCLLSAGVFRGNVKLDKVIELGLQGVLRFYSQPPAHVLSRVQAGETKAPVFVAICAFTSEEQRALKKVLDGLANKK